MKFALVAALLCLSVPALAQSPDPVVKGPSLADVAPSDPIQTPSSTSVFSGCVGVKKNVCFAPSISISVAAINLTTKQVEGAFSPGVGYGATINPGKWSSFGLAAHFIMDPGAQNASASLIASLINGYFHIGVSKGFIGDTAWRIIAGPGTSVAF